MTGSCTGSVASSAPKSQRSKTRLVVQRAMLPGHRLGQYIRLSCHLTERHVSYDIESDRIAILGFRKTISSSKVLQLSSHVIDNRSSVCHINFQVR